MLEMRLPVRGVPLGGPRVVNYEQVLSIALFGRPREIERPGDYAVAANDHDLVMGEMYIGSAGYVQWQSDDATGDSQDVQT
jgi:hypothetical protein